MKKFLISLMFVTFFSFAQTSKIQNSVVEYQIYNNTDSPNKLNATLYINGSVSIYNEKYRTQEFIKSDGDDGAVSVFPAKFVFEPWIMYDHKKKEIHFFENISTNIFLVEDTYNNLEWNITDETKEISGYSCVKAKASFRGREWEVWFAPEIPVPYGPWKLHGLPGLIIEAKDSTGTYTIRAISIEFRKDSIFDKSFEEIYKTKNTKSISYQQFVKDYQEYLDNSRAKVEKETGGKFAPQPRKGKELKFEWEK